MKKLWITVLLLLFGIQVTDATFLKEGVHQNIEEKLFNIFISEGIDTVMSKILVAQAAHESGKFTNTLTVKHKNVFSIMYSTRRKNLCLGGNAWAEGRKGYCSYSSIDSSARDMLLYMEYRKIPKTFKSITQYSKFLRKKHFYTASEKLYAGAVYKHYKQIWLKPKI